MLRIDTAAQLTVHCYYHVLGYESEGGTGDTQVSGPLKKEIPRWRTVCESNIYAMLPALQEAAGADCGSEVVSVPPAVAFASIV